jgi:hypothetical protein
MLSGWDPTGESDQRKKDCNACPAPAVEMNARRRKSIKQPPPIFHLINETNTKTATRKQKAGHQGS